MDYKKNLSPVKCGTFSARTILAAGHKGVNLNYLSLLIIIVSLSFFITGCIKKAVEKGKGKVTISIAYLYLPTDVGCQIIKKSIDGFRIENPDIKVKELYFTKDYWMKIVTMAASGTLPDIFRAYVNKVPKYVSKGILMPLDDFIENSKLIKTEDFFPAAINKYRFNEEGIRGKGSIYGFGTDWSPDYALFFNKTMFKEAGVECPTRSLSWEEFRDIAKRLTSGEGRDKQFGCLLTSTDLPVLIHQNGGKIFSEDGKVCLLNSPEAIESFQFLIDLRVKDKVIPSHGKLQSTGQFELFQGGRLGMFFSARCLVLNIQEKVKHFEWGAAPCLHHKKRANMTRGPHGFVMSKKTKHSEAAWKLMEYLIAGECERELAKAGYNIPAVKRIAYSPLFLNNPDHPEGINKLFLDEAEYVVPSPFTPYVLTDMWQDIMGREVELALLGKQSAKEAACNSAQKVNALIKSELSKRKLKERE